MIIIELTEEQYWILRHIMMNKAKEIHAWTMATKSTVRDAEYRLITETLSALKKVSEDK